MLRNKSILFVIFVFMKKVLVIDNYDSFVYNVIQLLREAVVPVGYDIVRNDKIDFSGLGDYGGILLSPGRFGRSDSSGPLSFLGDRSRNNARRIDYQLNR